MALSADKKARIKEVVKDILLSRQESFPVDISLNRNAPFHDGFLAAFRVHLDNVKIEPSYLVALASWMHGLNTSLGSGFENIAQILSGGYKKKFTQQFALKISAGQAVIISSIITDLKSGKRRPNLVEEDLLLKSSIIIGDALQDALGFTADNYLEQNNLIECIEMKSVRPNSGEGRGEKQKILNAKAAFGRIYPEKQIKFYVGFPFDPTSPTPTGYDKTRFMSYLIEFKKFFASDEVLIASELWDHLSGESNTMEQLLEIVSETVMQLANK